MGLALSTLLVFASCVIQSAHDYQEMRKASVPPAQSNALSSYRIRQEASPVFFLNERLGWVVSNGNVYRTTDGGKHWQRLYSIDSRHSVELIFVNDHRGWAVINEWSGKHAHLVMGTSDGGHSWRKLLNLESPIYKIDFVDDHLGTIRARWEILRRTSDAGKTWTEVGFEGDATLSLFEGLQYFFFLTPNEGWGYGSGIWHTRDGASKWTEVVSLTTR